MEENRMITKKKQITTLTIVLLSSAFSLNAMSRYIPRATAAAQQAARVNAMRMSTSAERMQESMQKQRELRAERMKERLESQKELRESYKAGKFGAQIRTATPVGCWNPQERQDALELIQTLAKTANLNAIDPVTGQPISHQLAMYHKDLLIEAMLNDADVDVAMRRPAMIDEQGDELLSEGPSLIEMVKSGRERVEKGERDPFDDTEEQLATLVEESADDQ